MATNSKVKKRTLANEAGEFGWDASNVKLGSQSYGLKCFKLFGQKKSSGKSSTLSSPLGWMLNEALAEPVKVANRWMKSLFKDAPNHDLIAGQVFEQVAELTEVYENRAQGPSVSDAIIALAAAHSLRAIAGKCEFANWYRCVEQLLDLAQIVESNVDIDPVVYQLIAVELPMTIAFQTPSMDEGQQLAQRTCRKLEVSATEMLDHDGWPHGSYLSSFGPLVASWARTVALSNDLDLEIKSDVAAQLEWTVRQTLRLSRPDGTLMFSESGAVSRPFLKTLLRMSSDAADDRLVKRRFPKKTIGSKKTRLPSASNISEWAGAALLQSDWSPDSPKIGLDFSKRNCRVEISRWTRLIEGNLFPEITSNGKPIESMSDFEVVCEMGDSDLEYLELEMELSNEFRLVRQVLLSRQDEFLMIGDLVAGKTDSKLIYRLPIPFAPGVKAIAESETREVYLANPKIQALVIPCALPEWKSARSEDRLTIEKDQLVLSQSTGQKDGCGLYAPVFFDLSSSRSKKKRTWRQLTVAQDREPVAKDQACAFRVQLDRQQWIFYRAVGSQGNRTFFGENFNGEFVFNRFEKNGTVTQLIQIDD
jgi:hypothetical protein